jgi:hypothetical protein
MPTLNNYPLDYTGVANSNHIAGENHTLTKSVGLSYQFIVPDYAPFYGASMHLHLTKPDNTVVPLIEGVHYHLSHKFITASRQLEKEVFGSITFINNQTEGIVTIEQYQTVGGPWTLSASQLTQALSDILRNPRVVAWEQVANLPYAFPPIVHSEDAANLVGADAIVTALNLIATTLAQQAGQTTINLPIAIPSKNQIGLGLVGNFPMSTDQEAIAGQSSTRYISPANLRAAISTALSSFQSEYTAVVRPSSGAWTAGQYVRNKAPAKTVYINPNSPLTGATTVTKGWIRMTSGTQHVAGTDWVDDISFVL